MSKEEEDEREDALAEVMDPMYMMRGEGEVDADGEVDDAAAFNAAMGISVDS
jgi:RNA polymerase II-associated factor 1